MARYAEVAVEAPVRARLGSPESPAEDERAPRLAAFHYAIPPRLRATVRLGQWVWVPFGSRNLTGIVVALDTQPPEVELREIAEVIDERPVLSEAQMALARWMSDYYLAPLFDCVCLFLPPGAAPRVETLYRLMPRELPRLTPHQKRIVALLQEHGSLTRSRLEHLLHKSEARAAAAAAGRPRRRAPSSAGSLDTLVRRNVLERFTHLAPPRVGPSLGQEVRLVVGRGEALRRLLATTPLPAAGRVLLALAEAQEQGDPLLPLSVLERLVGASSLPLARLQDQGWLTLSHGETFYAAGQPDEIAEADRQPAERAALALLRVSGPLCHGELVAAGHSPRTLRSLRQRGLVSAHETATLVSLSISAESARERALNTARSKGALSALGVLLANVGPLWLTDLTRLAGCDRAAVERLTEAGIATIAPRRVYRDPLVGVRVAPLPPVELSNEQETVLEPVIAALRGGRQEAFLLHGVTGSGKTEMYLRAIERTLALGRQAIVLVPEIALTPQAVRRFAARFAGRIAVQHSGLSEGERYDQWSQVRDDAADIVIGSRSAIFAPLPRHGLIVVDEEHERSYKQEERPLYHAREVALELGRLTGAVVILGSATPDVGTYRAAERGDIRLLPLPHRYGRGRAPEMPPVTVVDMRQELRQGRTGLLSLPLQQALGNALEKGEQSILFLNRRGSATFVMCRDCGYVAECPRCHLPLTYHLSLAATSAEAAGGLVCHHCTHRSPAPLTCPRCSGARIRYFGAGTERLQAYTQSLFPRARIVRWDRDTTRGRGGHDAILERFLHHEADVLVGTQMVAKGLDLPLVTVVGVVAADTAIFLPDYRAGERAFQLLAQVVGRAGRGERQGLAFIQTYHPEHYAVLAASRHDYESFYRQEIDRRWQLAYPPFGQMVRLLYSGSDSRACHIAAERLAGRLRLRIRQLGLPNLEVIGPSPCFYSRLRGRYRWHMILRGHGAPELLREETLPLDWRVDVDPVSFL